MPDSYRPEWVPSQLKPDSEVSEYERRARQRRRARKRDDYTQRPFSFGETLANSISQGAATVLAVVALVVLIIVAVHRGGGVRLAVALLYAIPMILAYLMSTLYHAISASQAHQVFKVLNNSFTYIFIVASMAPYCLLTLEADGGSWLYAAECVIAAAAVAAESIWATRPRWLPSAVYALMVLIFLIRVPLLYALLPAPGFWLLVIGGVCFAVSVLIKVFSQVPYLRFVSHIVSVAATVCIFLSVVLFVI